MERWLILSRMDHIIRGAASVTEAILQKWLTSDAPTRTYQHLIECLRQSELGALAEQLISCTRYAVVNIVYMYYNSPTHSLLTHSLTLLTYSLTCPPTHSLTHPLNLDSHSPTHSLIPLFYHTANLCQDVEEDIATIPVTRDSREHVRRCVVLQ